MTSESNKYLYPFFLVLIMSFCACENSKSTQTSSKNTDKPNIIYILADDLGYGELGAYGQTKLKPQILMP